MFFLSCYNFNLLSSYIIKHISFCNFILQGVKKYLQSDKVLPVPKFHVLNRGNAVNECANRGVATFLRSVGSGIPGTALESLAAPIFLLTITIKKHTHMIAVSPLMLISLNPKKISNSNFPHYLVTSFFITI